MDGGIADIHEEHPQDADNVPPERQESHAALSRESFSTNSTHMRVAIDGSYDLSTLGASILSADGNPRLSAETSESYYTIPIVEEVVRVPSQQEVQLQAELERLTRLRQEEAPSAPEEGADQSNDSRPDASTVYSFDEHRNRKLIFGMVLLTVMLFPSFVLLLLPTSVQPDEHQPQTREQRIAEFTSFLNNMTYSGRELVFDENSTNPSDIALFWLVDSDPMQLRVDKDREHIVQRFALLTIIFGLFNDKDFLKGEDYLHECDAEAFPAWGHHWKCDSENVIREIYAEDLGFSGTLPEDVGLLTGLSILHSRDNFWTGTIPASVGELTRLESLKLSRNELRGTLSVGLGLLTSLSTLELEENQFTGTIPSSLGNLTHLSTLTLQGNQLSGAIPPALAQIRRITNALLHNNEFTGSMPFCTVGRASEDNFVLVADCHQVNCSCCIYCCPEGRGDTPVYQSCA